LRMNVRPERENQSASLEKMSGALVPAQPARTGPSSINASNGFRLIDSLRTPDEGSRPSM